MTTESLDSLSVDDLLEIAAGVIGEVAVGDHGLLASAAARPRTSAFGADAYPTFAGKAAALIHSGGSPDVRVSAGCGRGRRRTNEGSSSGPAFTAPESSGSGDDRSPDDV